MIQNNNKIIFYATMSLQLNWNPKGSATGYSITGFTHSNQLNNEIKINHGLPLGEWCFQIMFASGRPTARHIRLTLLPSFTVTSFDMLVILAGTEGRKKNRDWCFYSN